MDNKKTPFHGLVLTLFPSWCDPKSIIIPPVQRGIGILHWEKTGCHLPAPGTAFLPRAAPPWGHPAPTSSCHPHWDRSHQGIRTGPGSNGAVAPPRHPRGYF